MHSLLELGEMPRLSSEGGGSSCGSTCTAPGKWLTMYSSNGLVSCDQHENYGKLVYTYQRILIITNETELYYITTSVILSMSLDKFIRLVE